MQIQRIIFLILIVILFACGPKAKFVKMDNLWTPPKNVAVLPFENFSNDTEGPNLVRLLFIQQLINKGFNPQNFEETDKILRDLGITDGGQLNSISSIELVKNLGVDGLFYGKLLNFKYSVGILKTTRNVKLNVKLIDGWRNDLYWESEQEHDESKSRLGAIMSLNLKEIAEDAIKDIGKDLLVKGLSQALKGMLGHPLYSVANTAVNNVIITLPYYREGYNPPSDAEYAKVETKEVENVSDSVINKKVTISDVDVIKDDSNIKEGYQRFRNIEILLRNNDRINAEIMQISAENVILKINDKEKKINKNDVDSIYFKDKKYIKIYLKSGNFIQTDYIDLKSDSIIINDLNNGSDKLINRDEIDYIVF